MSKIDELIQKLCSDGVEYFKLKDVSEMKRGTSFSKKNSVIGEYPVISGGKEPAFYCDKYNRDGETITVAGSGAGAGYVQYWNKKIFVADAFSLKGNECINTKFLYYLLTNMQQDIYSKKTGGGIPHVHISDLENVYIPLPPLEVQSEIVRILDKFTLLTAELTAELTARKKQYEYYRDNLLSFKDNILVEWKTLKEISNDIFRGSGIKRDEVTSDGIPCVRYGEIYTKYGVYFDKCFSHVPAESVRTKKYFEYGDILFAITGESVDDIAKSTVYVGHEKCLAGGDIVVVKHNQNPKYMAFVLSTMDARRQKSKGKVKSKVVHSNVSSIESIKIPVPSLEIQEKISSFLDNFDSICSDLKIGLPAEMEARKKQYVK